MITKIRSLIIGWTIILGLFWQPANAQFFEHDPDDPATNAPMREGEKAVIPLDTGDPGYNVWQQTRDDLMKGREPGPINVQRFPG
ncbi:MAG: hypothetical protein ACN4GW_20480, partial [Desulforhopalus sp.]